MGAPAGDTNKNPESPASLPEAAEQATRVFNEGDNGKINTNALASAQPSPQQGVEASKKSRNRQSKTNESASIKQQKRRPVGTSDAAAKGKGKASNTIRNSKSKPKESRSTQQSRKQAVGMSSKAVSAEDEKQEAASAPTFNADDAVERPTDEAGSSSTSAKRKVKTKSAAARPKEARSLVAKAPSVNMKDGSYAEGKGKSTKANNTKREPDRDVLVPNRKGLIAEILRTKAANKERRKKNEKEKERRKRFPVPGHPECQSMQCPDYDVTDTTHELYRGYVLAETSIDYGKPRNVLCKDVASEQQQAKVYAMSQLATEPERLKSLVDGLQTGSKNGKPSQAGNKRARDIIGQLLKERFMLKPVPFLEHGRWDFMKLAMAAQATASIFQTHGITGHEGTLLELQEQRNQIKNHEELINMIIGHMDDWCDNKQDEVDGIFDRLRNLEQSVGEVASKVLSPKIEEILAQQKAHDANLAKQLQEYDARIKDVEGTVQAHETRIGKLEETVNDHGTHIANHSTQIAELQREIEQLRAMKKTEYQEQPDQQQGQHVAKSNDGAVGELKALADAQGERIKDLEEQLGTLRRKQRDAPKVRGGDAWKIAHSEADEKNMFTKAARLKVSLEKLLYIEKGHFNRLKRGRWLNGEIIDAFLSSKVVDLDDGIHVFHHSFVAKLLNKDKKRKNKNFGQFDYKQVQRWTQRIKPNIFDGCKKLYIPVNVNGFSHWILAEIDFDHKRISLFDSYRNLLKPRRYLLWHLFHFLEIEHKKKDLPIELSDWDLIDVELTQPFQENDNDCGVFICIFAYLLSRGHGLQFFQKDITEYGRYFIGLSILEAERKKAEARAAKA